MKYIILHGHADTWKDAITCCADALAQAGIAGPDFGAKCIAREKIFPTGLPAAVPVAIPHCQDETIITDAVCILFPDSPVPFRRMDDASESIAAEAVFTLAFRDPDKHIDMLRNLAALFKSKEKMNDFRNRSDIEMIKYLEQIG